MERDLEQLELQSPLVYQSAEKGIQLCRDALHSTRGQVIKNGFKNLQQECIFFKTIKPAIVGNLIFYLNVIHIGIHRPLGSRKERNAFYREYISNLGTYFLEHRELYQYFIGQLTHLDMEYFSRNNLSAGWYCESLASLIDTQFSTPKDMVFAQIIGNMKTINYLRQEMADKKKHKVKEEGKSAHLKWTGAKVDLVELVYALHSSGIINYGRADLKEIAEAFETVFHISIGDYYRTFLEIRERKGNQLKFLEILKSCLINRIVETDG